MANGVAATRDDVIGDIVGIVAGQQRTLVEENSSYIADAHHYDNRGESHRLRARVEFSIQG
jgi:hypothetical protein